MRARKAGTRFAASGESSTWRRTTAFSFHPNGKWFYSIQEEGATVVLFDYDGARGQLTAETDDLVIASRICRKLLLLRDSCLAGRTFRCTLVTDCTTVSASFPSGLTERSHLLVTSGLAGNYPRSFNFDPPVGSCTAAISEQTMSPCSRSIRNPDG